MAVDWSTIAGCVGAAIPLLGMGWRIAHNTGKTANDMEQIKTICAEFKNQLKEHSEASTDHSTRLVAVEKDTENHSKRLDRAEDHIAELQGHHRRTVK